MNSSYRLTAICFGIGVTLHNLEEAVYWPRWVSSNLRLFFEPNRKIYWILTSLISVVIWIPIVGVCLSRPQAGRFQNVLSGFALAVAVNAVFPHLALSLAKRSYAPGTATGMLLNLPLGVLLIREQLAAAATASSAYLWRNAVLYALLLAVGAYGCLFAAHAIVAARKS